MSCGGAVGTTSSRSLRQSEATAPSRNIASVKLKFTVSLALRFLVYVPFSLCVPSPSQVDTTVCLHITTIWMYQRRTTRMSHEQEECIGRGCRAGDAARSPAAKRSQDACCRHESMLTAGYRHLRLARAASIAIAKRHRWVRTIRRLPAGVSGRRWVGMQLKNPPNSMAEVSGSG